MTLPTPNNSQPSDKDTKQSTPNSSPRSSPRPSPRPQKRTEYFNSDTHLSLHYRERSSCNQRNDFSLGDINGRNSDSQISSEVNKSPLESGINKERKDRSDKVKKKSSWYNVLYPTYKSRSEDFKRIFKDVKDDERLVVDYSCALQKEILVHGRLYVTQNYLCFYANIFRWETLLSLKWKDVTSITKEKTALVIPNAILVTTKTEKHFLTSFAARDKTYLMLFRVWQNALMDQPMSPQELWQWVHQCYGEELGLTSDDEDYIPPGSEDKLSTSQLSVESYSEECGSTGEAAIMENMLIEDKEEDVNQNSDQGTSQPEDNGNRSAPVGIKIPPTANSTVSPRSTKADQQLTTDMSDTTESDVEKPLTDNVVGAGTSEASNHKNHHPDHHPSLTGKSPKNSSLNMSFSSTAPTVYKSVVQKIQGATVEAKCTSPHVGRELLNAVVPIHIDQLFTLLFTSSKFFLDFHASRKTTDLSQSPWAQTSTNVKSRTVTSTVALNQSVGPKSAQVTETQVMLPCSKPGALYAIDIDTVNAGVPYADSFTINVHYCLSYVSEHQSRINVLAEIKYKKSVWGLVKGMIEKNCWQGLEDFYTCLLKALENEADTVITPTGIKRKSRKRKRHIPYPRDSHHLDLNRTGNACPTATETCTGNTNSSFQIILIVVLLALLFLNVNLYYKLWSLEESPPYTVLDLHVLKETPKSHEEWVILLQQQETLHTVEIQKWQRGLKRALTLLKQTEVALVELSTSIHPTYTEKVISVLQNNKETVNNINKMNEDVQKSKVPQKDVKSLPKEESVNVEKHKNENEMKNPQHTHNHRGNEPIEVVP